MKKSEAVNLIKWMYFTECNLESAVNNYEYRFLRRELDEVDLLEEIIAKSNYKFFLQCERDILKIVGLTAEEK